LSPCKYLSQGRRRGGADSALERLHSVIRRGIGAYRARHSAIPAHFRRLIDGVSHAAANADAQRFKSGVKWWC